MTELLLTLLINKRQNINPPLFKILQNPRILQPQVYLQRTSKVFQFATSQPTSENNTSKYERLCWLAIVGFDRNEQGKSVPIYSNNRRFRSERDFSYSKNPLIGMGWEERRIVKEVPLFVSNEKIVGRKTSEDYELLPVELRTVFETGMLRTAGKTRTNYSVLMVTTEEKRPDGRTGVLLFRGKPVVVQIDGKDFIVEIKGVGSPDGVTNRPGREFTGLNSGGYEKYGNLQVKEGETEFEHLELCRRNNLPTFVSGNSVRSSALFYFEDTSGEVQAYKIRLSPTSVRASFVEGAFRKNDEMKVTRDIARHYVEMARMDIPLLHRTIHPENILRVGNTYVLTDFADSDTLETIEEVKWHLKATLHQINQLPGISQKGIDTFYLEIAKGLCANWDPKTGYDGFIEAIWAGYFAPIVYSLRKGNPDLAEISATASKEFLARNVANLEEHHLYLLINGLKTFLEREIDMLKHADDQKAGESMLLATKRIEFLNQILEDDGATKKFLIEKADELHGMYFLPYMRL